MQYILMFPGQGSQKIGMAKDFYSAFESVRKRFSLASSIFKRDFEQLLFQGSEEELKETQNTQPALYLVETCICDRLYERGIQPEYTLGHSLGEYSALYAAGFMDFTMGLDIVIKRGKLMASAGENQKGGMAAVIGLPKSVLLEVLTQVKSGTIVSANENAPDQIVISGSIEALDVATGLLTKAGAKRIMKLQVSAAFHSPLMQHAADEFEKYLSTVIFHKPQCPVISNVCAEPVTNPEQAKALLVQQLLKPVRWIDSMEYLKQHSQSVAIEVGPSTVLKGLVKKCDPGRNVISCETVDDLYSRCSPNPV